MMNPSTYIREAKRIESETVSRIQPKKMLQSITKLERSFSREELPGGCILYTMTGHKTMR
jgi:hypothetical protein